MKEENNQVQKISRLKNLVLHLCEIIFWRVLLK